MVFSRQQLRWISKNSIQFHSVWQMYRRNYTYCAFVLENGVDTHYNGSHTRNYSVDQKAA